MTTERLTASVKVRILKPLGRDWDEVGARLRDLSWMAHRVLNGTMTRLTLAAALPDQIPEEWRSRRNPSSEARPGGKPSAYQMASCSIELANRERVTTRPCAWCQGTGLEPSSPPQDHRGRDKKPTKAQAKRERSAGEVCARCDGAREYTIGESVEVPAAIQNGWQRMAQRRHSTDHVEVMRGQKSIASYRAPAPIAIVSSGEPFKLRKEECGYVLEIPLYPGGAAGRVPFALKPDGPVAFGHLGRMLAPGSKIGDLKILAPKDGKKNWLAIFSYSWEREKPTPRSGPQAVIRAAPDGSPEIVIANRRPKRLYEGATLVHKRKVFALRRAGRSRHQRDISAGARGHGRARTFEHYHAVDNAERRWITSICQEIAAKAVREADLRGACWVCLDPTLTVLPPATLQSALAWALQKAGFVGPDDSLSQGRSDSPLGEGGSC